MKKILAICGLAILSICFSNAAKTPWTGKELKGYIVTSSGKRYNLELVFESGSFLGKIVNQNKWYLIDPNNTKKPLHEAKFMYDFDQKTGQLDLQLYRGTKTNAMILTRKNTPPTTVRMLFVDDKYKPTVFKQAEMPEGVKDALSKETNRGSITQTKDIVNKILGGPVYCIILWKEVPKTPSKK